MANTIILKKTSTAAKVPLAGDLQIGELAVNLADQKLYSKNASGTVILVGQGVSGTGDVVGPSSATDNAVARFNSTTGKLIQNSVVTVDDTGNVAGILSEQYDIANTPPAIVAGLEAWDDGNGTLEIGLKGGNVSYKYGQQEYVRAYNGSGTAMTKGQVVYIVGAQGNRVDVRLAQANAESTSAGTIGIVAESIAIGAEGFAQTSGSMYKLNTNTLTAGAAIYLSSTIAGAYTTTKPSAPTHTVILGWVERVSATVGSIYIKVDNGYELDELHNVLITSPASGNTLIYDAAQGVWENNNLSAGTGISITNGAGTITIAATNSGTVTSVTGTSPVVSSGGATPAISLASGYGDTLNPYASKTANYVLAAPNGTAGVPTFRAIVATDIPTLNQNTTGSAATLTTTRAIYGNNFNGSAALTQIIASTYGGTGNGFTKFTGATTAEKTYTLPDATATILTSNAAVTVAQGGTGQTSYTDGQLLIGNTTGNTLAKATLTAGSGISITNGAGAITIASTSGGTVTSVTGTAPVVSSGGTTPAISMAAATASVNGYLTSTDWTTFNGKTSNTGTVTSVSATVPAFLSVTGSPVTTSGTLAIGLSGTALPIANGGTGAITAPLALTALGAYAATNPSGFTSNTGTVTSVSGTGTASGLTLSGTVTTTGNLTLSGTASVAALSTASGSAPSYSARAWVNFNGTGTPAVRASGNVSSIGDNGVGNYTVNFSTALPDANYSAVASVTSQGSANGSTNCVDVFASAGGTRVAPTSSAFRLFVFHPGNQVAQDVVYVTASAYR